MTELQAALAAAYKILAKRALSEKALRERLVKKKIPARTIDRAVKELTETRLLSDQALAENMAQSRVKDRLLGNFRIEQDMIQRGIPREMVQKAVRQAADEADSPTEEERAFQALKKRAAQIRLKDPEALKRRLFGYLARRGFDPETIQSALERYGRQAP